MCICISFRFQYVFYCKMFLIFYFYIFVSNILIFFWGDCVDFLYLSLVLRFLAALCSVSSAVFDSLGRGLCDPMDHSPPGSSAHGGSPGEKTGVRCMPYSRASSQPRDPMHVSRTAGAFFTV